MKYPRVAIYKLYIVIKKTPKQGKNKVKLTYVFRTVLIATYIPFLFYHRVSNMLDVKIEFKFYFFYLYLYGST